MGMQGTLPSARGTGAGKLEGLHSTENLLINLSGHLRYADVKPDDESLLCVVRNIFSPVLDPQKWEWPETLVNYGMPCDN